MYELRYLILISLFLGMATAYVAKVYGVGKKGRT
jgi:hypothetical protein